MSLFILLYVCAVVFLADAGREREEDKDGEGETETEVITPAVFKRAGSVQQNAPPILKGDSWAGRKAEEDGEEGEGTRVVCGCVN